MNVNSTKSASRRKSNGNGWQKPYDDFPLSYHPPSGRLYKKIQGTRYYFGYVENWQAAVDTYLDEEETIRKTGRRPRQGDSEEAGQGLTLKYLCNHFLTSKQDSLDVGEIAPVTFREYKATCDRLVALFGRTRVVEHLAADDFQLLRKDIATSWGPVRLGNEIQRVRSVFKYAYENALIEKPVRYGSEFKNPARRVLRKARNKNGKRMLQSPEIRALLAEAAPQMKAMMSLGINSGFGNKDVGCLTFGDVDLDGGWIDFPRPKTGIERRCPLWPETIEAVRAAIEQRPDLKDDSDANLIFVTKYGGRWWTSTGDAVAKETIKLLKKLRIHRRGLGFYSLRHTFRTVADATRDFPAVRLIMGHADDSIDAHYREEIEDDRLRTVADRVHAWLFDDKEGSRV